jgi:hypothetical protein
MSIVQARNKLKWQKKGSRKDPTQILSLGDHTPSATIFLSNTGNCTHCNNLSYVAMNLQKETAAQMLGSPTTAASTPMLERVQKRVLDRSWMWVLLCKPKGLQPNYTNSLPIMMPHSHPLSLVSRRYSACRKIHMPALIYNTSWISKKS